ncbi:hypothetical protein RchiOBHm_Chr4g0413221 [Rosa chinensis]|uniref:Uncharacterized protein n=1 Tax=Rosa chinensis TaxID=74649 RepID=A0A2P6QW20_ROSCH|nr:hypothetical protein RchiOBHm_Chr4g0413221 [Rosa chinensis]
MLYRRKLARGYLHYLYSKCFVQTEEKQIRKYSPFLEVLLWMVLLGETLRGRRQGYWPNLIKSCCLLDLFISSFHLY